VGRIVCFMRFVAPVALQPAQTALLSIIPMNWIVSVSTILRSGADCPPMSVMPKDWLIPCWSAHVPIVTVVMMSPMIRIG